MIMRLGRKTSHEFFVAKAAVPALGSSERRLHRSWVSACFAPQIHLCACLGIEHIIAFVLGVGQAELLLNVTGQGVYLQRQVAAGHGIEKVETDGEFCAETVIRGLPEQSLRLGENQVDRRNFDFDGTETEAEAILLWHAVETPGEVGLGSIEIADLLHPLPAPRPGIEKRNRANRPRRAMTERRAQSISFDKPRIVRCSGVEHIIPARHRSALHSIGSAPVDEECSLIFQ